MAGDSSGAVYSADNSGYQSITGYVVSGDVTFVAQTSLPALDSGSEAGMTGSDESTALPLDSATTPDGSAQNDSDLDSGSEAGMTEFDDSVILREVAESNYESNEQSNALSLDSPIESANDSGGQSANDNTSLLGTSLFGLASPFLSLLGAPITTLDAGSINSASIEVLYDGTVNKNGSMDGDDLDGNDSSLTNKRVRNNDYIGYKLSYVAGTPGEVTVVIQLPDGMEWDSSALEGAKMPGSSISNDGKTLTAVRDINGSASLELKARVYNHKQGDTVTLVSAEIGGKTATGVAATTVTVSAAPNYVLSFTKDIISGGTEAPGPNMGASYNYSGEDSRLLELGVEIYAPIDANKEYKGIAPLTSVTFQLNSTIASVFATSMFGSTQGGLANVPAAANRGTWTPASFAVINTQNYTVSNLDTSFKNPAATTNHNATPVEPANAYFIAARCLWVWHPPATLTDGGTKPTPVVFDLESTTAGVSSGTSGDTNYSGDGIKNQMSYTIPALSNQLIFTTFTRSQNSTWSMPLHKGETFNIENRAQLYALTPSQTNAVFYSTWDDAVAEYDTRGVVHSPQGNGSPVTWGYEYGHVADYTVTPPSGTTWYATPKDVLDAGLSINAVRAIPTSTADPSVSIKKAAGFYDVVIPAVVKSDATATTFTQRFFYVSDQYSTGQVRSHTVAVNPAGIDVDLAWQNEFNGSNVQKPGPQQVLKLTPWVAGNSAYTYNSRNYLTPTTGTADDLQVVVSIPDATHLSVNIASLQTLLDSKYPGLGATVTGDTSTGSTVLTFNFGRVVGSGYLPTLDIPVDVPLDTSVGTRIATAVISSPSDNINQNYRQASSQIAFNQIQEFAVQKTASELFAQSGDSVTWTLNYVNFSPAGPITELKLVDVLPYTDDGRTTTGLTAPLQITGVDVGSSGATVEYTDDTLADVLIELAADGSGETGIDWDTTAPPAGTVTAVRFSIASVANGATGSVSFTTKVGLFKTGGVLNNDAYVTTKEVEMPNVSAAPVVSSASTVFGTVYKDMDFSGDFSSSPVDTPLEDVEVTLTTADATLRSLLTGLFGDYTLTRITDEFGAYSFADLPAGAYTVSAPAVTNFADFKYIEPADGTNSYDVTLAPSTAPRYNFGLQPTLWNLSYEMNAPDGSDVSGVTLPVAQTGISTASASAAVGAPSGVPLRTDGAGVYTFKGWASSVTAVGGNVTYPAASVDTATVPAQPAGTDFVLYAVWDYTPTFWNLTYYTNIPADATDPTPVVIPSANANPISTANASDPLGVPAGLPIKANGSYVFDGWATSAAGDVDYLATDTISAKTSGTTIELYAHWTWTRSMHKLSFVLNDTSAAPSVPVAIADVDAYGAGLAIASAPGFVAAPTRIGYTFDAWYLDAAFNTTLASAPNMPDSNATIYAKWTADPYSVNFSANAGGTLVGQASYTNIEYATAWAGNITVPVPTPDNPPHYSFIGWTGSGLTTPTLNPTWPTTITSALSYVANFELDSHTLTYHGNGYTGGAVPGAVSYLHGTEVTVANQGDLVRTGYTFLGWDSVASAVTPTYPLSALGTAKVTVNDETDLYAIWGTNTITIDYDLNDSVGVNAADSFTPLAGSESAVYGGLVGSTLTSASGYYVAPGDASRTGYTFKGWYDSAAKANAWAGNVAWDFSADTVTDPAIGTKTLYAAWDINAYGYTITHHFLGGPQAGSALVVETGSRAFGDTVSAPTTATYTGYTYLAGHSSEVLSGTVGVSGLSLHVYYQANIYTVSYNGNGNTGGAAPGLQFGEYMAGLSVAGQGGLVRAGYSFLGWSENSAAGAPTWGAGGIITLDRNYTLYAIWSLDPTYTLVYAAGGDNVVGLPTGATGIAPGTTITVGAAPTRTGFAFVGYAASTGATLQPGDYFNMPAANVTLTALWEPSSFNVTYQAGGAGVTGLPVGGTYNAGDTVTVGAAPVRTGFTFEGYSSSIGGTVRPGNTFVMPANDVVLTATWDEIITGTTMSNGNNIKRFDIDGLRQLAVSLGQPAYRGNQLADWLYLRGAQNFDDMTNLPKKFRADLVENYGLFWPEVVRQQQAGDGTRKYLLRLEDGVTVETVAIVSGGRLTVCFSTQAGCAMGCVFCATGRLGLQRSLTCGEMVDQLLVVADDFKARITNVVAMGQGEPFANYEPTLMALRLINNADLLGVGARHITVSTCGLTRQIRRFATESEQFTLAVSLHSAVQETRDKLMPGLTGQPLEQLRSALLDYMKQTGRRPSLEYALIDGVNDTPEQMDALVEFCTVPAPGLHVNLIRLNQSQGCSWSGSASDKFKQFEQRLIKANVGVSTRASRGAEISAACGQLAGQQ
ncbi:hypothetical protein FACS1894104_1900 [Actinomycetota bacterium]|nr:hypothetical protein FACS1894104_1900 [Actinomycetota bacterium]